MSDSEVADLRAQLAAAEAKLRAVEALADWYDEQPNWREWRIGASIRKALSAVIGGGSE